MIHKKYQLLILKDNAGTCSTFTLRIWICFLVVGIFLISLAMNAFLYNSSRQAGSDQAKLQLAQQTLENQQLQFLALTEKLQTLEAQINRITDFNTEIRAMANLDLEHVPIETSLGGAERRDFPDQHLTAHRQELLVRKMHNFLEQLQTEVKLEELRQQELLAALLDNQRILASTPSIWPTEGRITSSFGYRRSPFTGRRELHKGLDIAAPIGTPIYATANGRVLSAGRDGAYGLTVTIDHGAGIVTLFAHMHRINVTAGQKVSRGELIGTIGKTGRTTGPHLHYEVRLNGVPVDPKRYVLN